MCTPDGWLSRAWRTPRREQFRGALSSRCTSGGGVTTVETARALPGAADRVRSRRRRGRCLGDRPARRPDQRVSFDMGGTTAKICLIDDGQPREPREFEVARARRFMKGSGLPLRIPVIEHGRDRRRRRLDRAGRRPRALKVGPESAGAEPGPACYSRGGTHRPSPTRTLPSAMIDPDAFAGGTMELGPRAATARCAAVGEPWACRRTSPRYGVYEVVDENMANAARVHAIERGEISAAQLIAFGGAAPLHAARVAEKIGVARVIVPVNAGVGSAVGFLRRPIAYELVRSLYMRLTISTRTGHALFRRWWAEARALVVERASRGRSERRAGLHALCRTGPRDLGRPCRSGELTRPISPAAAPKFEARYRALFDRPIPGAEIEVLSWVGARDAPRRASPCDRQPVARASPRRKAVGQPQVLRRGPGEASRCPLYRRGTWHRARRLRAPPYRGGRDVDLRLQQF